MKSLLALGGNSWAQGSRAAATEVPGSYLGPATYQKLLKLLLPLFSPVKWENAPDGWCRDHVSR